MVRLVVVVLLLLFMMSFGIIYMMVTRVAVVMCVYD